MSIIQQIQQNTRLTNVMLVYFCLYMCSKIKPHFPSNRHIEEHFIPSIDSTFYIHSLIKKHYLCADIGLYITQRRLYSTVFDVTLIRCSQGTYNLRTRATRSFLHSAVAITWTISVSYPSFIHTVDIRPQLLQNASNLILLTLNQVSFVK